MEELKSKGLKAYDLVWLDGKSAAWRYPSEIEELKAFAPAVEEQPYDRFYKKNLPAQATATSVIAAVNQPIAQPIVAEEAPVEAIIVNKPVVVTTTQQPVAAKKDLYNAASRCIQQSYHYNVHSQHPTNRPSQRSYRRNGGTTTGIRRVAERKSLPACVR